LKISLNHTLLAGGNTWNLSWQAGQNELADISQIVSGRYHSLALKSDGTRVYAWGYNYYGQLGDNTTTNRYTPIEVKGIGGNGYLGDGTNGGPISAIAVGYYHSLALKSDGTRVYAWGRNNSGQLGDNTTTNRYTPIEVLGVGGNGYLGDGTNGGPISAISAGGNHSLALKSDGTRVYAWGWNGSGQLGDNTIIQRNTPIEVLGIGGNGYLGDGTNGGPISAISTKYAHSLALKSDGTRVYAWGYNYYGQLGDNTTTDRHTPIEVLGVGGNGYLGDGTNGGPISAISAGYGCSLALKSDGTRVYAWGRNTSGQLGDNTTTNRYTPIEVLGIGGTGYLGDGTNGGPISAIAVGSSYSLALKSDGTRVYAWGDNEYGQLGDNTTTDRHTPIEVLGIGGTGYLGDGTNGGPISAIAGGLYYSLALKSDGTRVYAWGDNEYGKLGDNTMTERHIPIEVKKTIISQTDLIYLNDISQIVSGGNHSLALKSDGTRVYAWGGNSYGQLGDNRKWIFRRWNKWRTYFSNCCWISALPCFKKRWNKSLCLGMEQSRPIRRQYNN